MLHSRFRQFGAITRAETQPDGSVMVFGIASSGNTDAEGETILPQAMQAALPDYARHPTLREMHQPSAAGRVTEAQVDEDGMTRIAAHVVDPVAVSKVKAGVYSGFSVGGKVLRRSSGDPSVIEAIRLVEISLVDSPCNPDATLNMWKADMRTYAPTNDDVIAEARRLAADAGSARYKDFLYKARQSLIARADNDDEDAPAEPPASDTPPPAPAAAADEPGGTSDFSDALAALLAEADPEQLQQAYRMLADLGVQCDAEHPAPPEADTEKVRLAAENAHLSKALAEAPAGMAELAKLRSAHSELEKRLAAVEAQPAAAKTAGIRAISKGEDASGEPDGPLTADQFEKHLNALPEKERGDLLLRLALKRPMLLKNI